MSKASASFTIMKRFDFCASHQLDHLPEGHQCARLHGHNYTVEVILSSRTLDPDSFVKDFGLLKPIEQFIKENLDHRHLNDVMGEFEESLIAHLSVLAAHSRHEWLKPSDEEVEIALRTTSENLARALYLRFKPDLRELHAIRISETPKTGAVYQEDE